MANEKDDSCMNMVVAITVVIVFSILGIRSCIKGKPYRTEYKRTIELKTDSAYTAFLNKYKDTEYGNIKYENVESALWEQTLKTSNYYYYIENAPEGRWGLANIAKLIEKHINAAYDSIWAQTLRTSDYDYYIKNVRQTYLTKDNIAAAKDSIEQIENRKWATDIKAWQRAQELNTVNSYKKYIEKYPDGGWSEEAIKMVCDNEVDEIFEKNPGKLPAMKKVVQGTGRTSIVTVQNSTSYTLTLRYSGIESKIKTIPPNSKGSIELKNGDYRVAASVNSGGVRNAAGKETLTGGRYHVEYYIGSAYLPW